MEDTKYRVLKEYGDLGVGEIITADEWDATPSEIENLLEDGTIELVIETPGASDDELDPPATPSTDDDDADQGSPTPDVPNPEQYEAHGSATEKAKYKVTGIIPIVDGQGQKQGEYQVGTVYEFIEETGNMYVDQGLAEKVEEE